MMIAEEQIRNVLLDPHRKVESIARTITFLCTLLVILYCVWTLDRGFEITDEAYYLLLAMHADSVKLFISAQQWITSGLWQITGSLVLFRVAGMVLLLASSLLLSLGVFSVCVRLELVEDHFVSKRVVMAGSVVGAMLYASTINFSPSYNLLASAGAYAAAGLVLLASNRASLPLKYALLVIAGCAVGAEGICKPSAGIATLVLLVLWSAIFERERIHKVLGPAAIALGGFVFAVIAMLVNTTYFEAGQAVEQGMKLFRLVQGETVDARLTRYVAEIFEYLSIIINAFAIPILSIVGYVLTRRIAFAQFGLLVLGVILIFGSLMVGFPTLSINNAIYNSYMFGGFNRYGIQVTAIFAMLVMATIVSIPVWNKNRKTRALFAGLILLPYTVAMGTGNTLFTQVIVSLAPWSLLIACLMVAHYPADLSRMPISVIGICFVVTVSMQIITSNFRPYNLSLPLDRQNQAVNLAGLGELKVDSGTYKFFDEINKAIKVCNIAPGAPFLGLYNIPGVALALQATPVLTPWLNNRSQAGYVMDRMSKEELHASVVAFQMRGDGIFPPLPSQMVDLATGYSYCGTATYPYQQQKIQIWQSRM